MDDMSLNPAPSWIDEFPARIAALDAAHLRRRRRAVVPAGRAHTSTATPMPIWPPSTPP